MAAIARVVGFLFDTYWELSNHLREKIETAQCANFYMQDLILCLHHNILSSLPLLSMGISLPPESVQSGDNPSSRQWELLGVADSSQLGTPERIRELEKMKEKRTEHGMTIAANL